MDSPTVAALTTDTGEEGGHYDQLTLEAIHQAIDSEPHKTVVPPEKVRKAV